jgi:hypothetical protein
MHGDRGKRRLQLEGLEHGGDHDRDLKHRDLHADACARPCAEGHPGVAVDTRELSGRNVEGRGSKTSGSGHTAGEWWIPQIDTSS